MQIAACSSSSGLVRFGPRNLSHFIPRLSTRLDRYKPFFLRSAQRFFIASDNRFLPSGVIPPRFFLFTPTRWGVPAPPFLAPPLQGLSQERRNGTSSAGVSPSSTLPLFSVNPRLAPLARAPKLAFAFEMLPTESAESDRSHSSKSEPRT